MRSAVLHDAWRISDAGDVKIVGGLIPAQIGKISRQVRRGKLQSQVRAVVERHVAYPHHSIEDGLQTHIEIACRRERNQVFAGIEHRVDV